MQSLESLCKVSVMGGEVVRPKVAYLPSEHQTYKVDGKKVLGASTIAGRDPDGKEILVKWANARGLIGIDTNAFLIHSANIGTIAHKMVELSLSGVHSHDIPSHICVKYGLHEHYDTYIEYASIAYLKYIEWITDFPYDHTFKPISTELPLTSKTFKYGGTIDIYGQLGDKKVLIDIKTSGNVYMSHKLQVSGYAHLLEENGYEVDDVYILQISRDADKPYHFERVDGTEYLFGIFCDLLYGHQGHKKYSTYLKSDDCKEAQATHDAWLENLRRG